MAPTIYTFFMKFEYEDLYTPFFRSKHATVWVDHEGTWRCGPWKLSHNEAMLVLEGKVKLPAASEIYTAATEEDRFDGWADSLNNEFSKYLEPCEREGRFA